MKSTWSIELLLEKDGRRLFSAHWGEANSSWLSYLRDDDFVVFSDASMPGPASKILEMRDKYPRGNWLFLSNDEQVYLERISKGVNTFFINQNAFVDERVFCPDALSEKKYDAIYNARARPIKRHFLAGKIEPSYKLALITGFHTPGLDSVPDEDMPKHTFINKFQLQPSTVARLLNQSKVGLILSPAEGACFASSEYLLCGLPVVSTKSTGGRDFWYDDYNSVICEDNVDSVLDAVDTLISEYRDPYLIREGHLKKMFAHRQKFVDLIFREAFPFLDDDLLLDGFLDKFSYRRYLAFQKKESWKTLEEIKLYLKHGRKSDNFESALSI